MKCRECDGIGTLEITVTCKRCKGTGWVGGRYGGEICCGGVDSVTVDCEDCNGTGIIEDELSTGELIADKTDETFAKISR
jgi:DnaJ-class molecular chaperone